MDKVKAAHCASMFLLLGGGRLTKLTLMKLMYLAERASLDARGFPMIYDRLVCMKHGPVLSTTLNLIGYKSPSPEWRDLIRSPAGGYHISLQQDACNLRPRDLGRLSKHDRSIIKRTWSQFGHMSVYELRDYTHTLPEYEHPGDTSVTLHYRDVLLALDKPPEMATDLAEDIEFHRRLMAG